MIRTFYEVIYRYFTAPWGMGPREELVALVERGRVAPCKAIDLGCRTGDNAIWLAQRGFEVTGVDFSPTAIAKAQRKAQAAGVSIDFIVDDLTALQHVTGPFDLLVDYGTFDDLSRDDRERYLRHVLPLVHPGSRFLLWCFEWTLRWWERAVARVLSFTTIALQPGDVETYFGRTFEIERNAGASGLRGFPHGYACCLMAPR